LHTFKISASVMTQYVDACSIRGCWRFYLYHKACMLIQWFKNMRKV